MLECDKRMREKSVNPFVEDLLMFGHCPFAAYHCMDHSSFGITLKKKKFCIIFGSPNLIIVVFLDLSCWLMLWIGEKKATKVCWNRSQQFTDCWCYWYKYTSIDCSNWSQIATLILCWKLFFLFTIQWHMSMSQNLLSKALDWFRSTMCWFLTKTVQYVCWTQPKLVTLQQQKLSQWNRSVSLFFFASKESKVTFLLFVLWISQTTPISNLQFSLWMLWMEKRTNRPCLKVKGQLHQQSNNWYLMTRSCVKKCQYLRVWRELSSPIFVLLASCFCFVGFVFVFVVYIDLIKRATLFECCFHFLWKGSSVLRLWKVKAKVQSKTKLQAILSMKIQSLFVFTICFIHVSSHHQKFTPCSLNFSRLSWFDCLLRCVRLFVFEVCVWLFDWLLVFECSFVFDCLLSCVWFFVCVWLFVELCLILLCLFAGFISFRISLLLSSYVCSPLFFFLLDSPLFILVHTFKTNVTSTNGLKNCVCVEMIAPTEVKNPIWLPCQLINQSVNTSPQSIKSIILTLILSIKTTKNNKYHSTTLKLHSWNNDWIQSRDSTFNKTLQIPSTKSQKLKERDQQRRIVLVCFLVFVPVSTIYFWSFGCCWFLFVHIISMTELFFVELFWFVFEQVKRKCSQNNRKTSSLVNLFGYASFLTDIFELSCKFSWQWSWSMSIETAKHSCATFLLPELFTNETKCVRNSNIIQSGSKEKRKRVYLFLRLSLPEKAFAFVLKQKYPHIWTQNPSAQMKLGQNKKTNKQSKLPLQIHIVELPEKSGQRAVEQVLLKLWRGWWFHFNWTCNHQKKTSMRFWECVRFCEQTGLFLGFKLVPDQFYGGWGPSQHNNRLFPPWHAFSIYIVF